MSIEAMKRIKSLLQDTKMIDSHTISAVVAECDMAILAKQPVTPEPVQTTPNFTQLMQVLDGLNRCHSRDSKVEFLRTWIRDWTQHKVDKLTHPAPSVPGDDFDLICNAIDKADTITMEGDYMLDSDDCIAVVRVMQVLLSVRAAMLAAK